MLEQGRSALAISRSSELAPRPVAQCVSIVVPQTLDHVFHPPLELILGEDIQRLGQSLIAVVSNVSLRHVEDSSSRGAIRNSLRNAPALHAVFGSDTPPKL